MKPAEIASLLFDPIQYVFLQLKNEFGQDPLRQEVLDHWREFGTKTTHVSVLDYSQETVLHTTITETYKTSLGEDLEKITYIPGSLEQLGINIFQIVTDEQVKADGDLVFCLLDPYRKLLSRYRTEQINGAEDANKTDLLPQLSKLTGVCIEYLQDYPGDPFIKRHLYQIFELIELTPQQKESILNLMDKQKDLRQPLALRLTAELAISDPECGWILEQERRRSELLARMEQEPQVIFDDYRNLAQLGRGLVWAGSWTQIIGNKVGMEIEYQRSETSPSWVDGFIEGADLSNSELRKDRKQLEFTPNYVRKIAMLSAFFGYQTGIDFSAFHLHLDRSQHPRSPGILFPFDQDNTRRNDLNTWEVRDLIFPTLGRLRRPPIDVRTIANVISCLTAACSEEVAESDLMMGDYLTLGQEQDKVDLNQLQMGHVLRATRSAEARLAFLLASENKAVFSAISLLRILSSYDDVDFMSLIDSVRDPFMINGLCHQFVLMLTEEIPIPEYIEWDECWTYIENNAGDQIAAELAERLLIRNFREAHFSRIWSIIEQKGGRRTAYKLIFLVQNSSIAKESIGLFLTFIEQRGDEHAIAEIVHLLGKSELDISCLDQIWRMIEKLDGEAVATNLVYRMRRLSNHQLPTGESHERAWKIIKQRGGKKTATALSHAIKYSEISHADISLALDLIQQKGGEKEANVLAQAIEEKRIMGDNVLTALNIIEKFGGETATTYLVDALLSDLLNGEALVLAWSFIQQKGGEYVESKLVHSLVLVHSFVDPKLDRGNFNQAWSFIQQHGGNVATNTLKHAVFLGQLSGLNLVLARNFIEWKDGSEAELTSVEDLELEELSGAGSSELRISQPTSIRKRIRQTLRGR